MSDTLDPQDDMSRLLHVRKKGEPDPGALLEEALRLFPDSRILHLDNAEAPLTPAYLDTLFARWVALAEKLYPGATPTERHEAGLLMLNAVRRDGTHHHLATPRTERIAADFLARLESMMEEEIESVFW